MVVDSVTGEIKQKIKYSDWGEILEDTSPGLIPFGYAGGMYDQDTKLIRFGARDYDPQIGRWLAKDPIRFAGGDANHYGYVFNDPINLIDPIGLETTGIGLGFSLTLGGANLSGDVQFVYDDQGNTGIATTYCGGGRTEVLGGGVNGSYSIGNGSTINDLNGVSNSTGGSVGEGITVEVTLRLELGNVEKRSQRGQSEVVFLVDCRQLI